MKKYKNIEELEIKALTEGCHELFTDLMKIAFSEEKRYIEEGGLQANEKAAKKAREKVLSWINSENDLISLNGWVDKEGMKYETFLEFEVSHLIALAIKHYLNKFDGN